MGADVTTLNETTRALDGTEWIRLATAGANWKAQISAIESFLAAPLTSANDTNVTLTLGGSPATAVLAATSITAGWTGQLAVGRGGTGAGTFTANGVLYGNTTSAIQVTAQGGANTVLTANAGAPSFSAAPTIGTSVTTPLIIGGTTASSTLRLESTSGVGTTDMILMLTGSQLERVRLDSGGIITFNDIASPFIPALAHVQIVDTTGNSLNISNYNTTGGMNPIFMDYSHNATAGTQGLVSSGDVLFSWRMRGSDGVAFQNAAAIGVSVDATAAANSMPGRLAIFTTPSGSTTFVERIRWDARGNTIIGTAAIATNATDGFLYLDSCAGAPSGTPTSYTGRAPLVYDTTDNRLYIYNTAWQLCTDTASWSQTTPTPTPGAGAFTTVSCTVRVKQVGKFVHVVCQMDVTTLGTATGDVTIPLPIGCSSGGIVATSIAGSDRSTGATVSATVNSGTSSLVLHTAGPGLAANSYAMGGVYESA